MGGLPRLTDGSIDYEQDFFGRKAFLTVSGQIQARLQPSVSGGAVLQHSANPLTCSAP